MLNEEELIQKYKEENIKLKLCINCGKNLVRITFCKECIERLSVRERITIANNNKIYGTNAKR